MDPELAQTFIRAAQEIIDTLIGGSEGHDKLTLVSREADGTTGLKAEAAPGALYIIEATTNLVDWEQVGVTTGNAAETFEFADTNSSLRSIRFYWVVSP